MVSFHIEPTSKCTLECPLCDRTWFYEKFKRRSLHEVDVDDLIRFVGKNAEVQMGGNNGDPIYHSRFHELCKKLKNNNCSIIIVTNGSAKTQSWWAELNQILDEKDSIMFSIDGLEDTNHIYRKNAKWNSIMTAVKVLKQRKCKTEWKFIVFKHNQHQIDEAKQLSKELGFDSFKLKKSDRWLERQDLMPDKKYISKYHEHQKAVIEDAKYTTTMAPWCIKNDRPSNHLYIDAEGDFYPCCWVGGYRFKYKSIFSPKKSNFNIKNNSLDDILNTDIVQEFFSTTKQFTSAHECCKIHCGVNNG